MTPVALLTLLIAQAGPGYRGGMRFVGLLLIVLLILAIVYVIRRIMAK